MSFLLHFLKTFYTFPTAVSVYGFNLLFIALVIMICRSVKYASKVTSIVIVIASLGVILKHKLKWKISFLHKFALIHTF